MSFVLKTSDTGRQNTKTTSIHLWPLIKKVQKDSWKLEVRNAHVQGQQEVKYSCPGLEVVTWVQFKYTSLSTTTEEEHWPEPDQSASSWIQCPRWARCWLCSWASASHPHTAWFAGGSGWDHRSCILRIREGRHGSQSSAYCSPETSDSPSLLPLCLTHSLTHSLWRVQQVICSFSYQPQPQCRAGTWTSHFQCGSGRTRPQRSWSDDWEQWNPSWGPTEILSHQDEAPYLDTSDRNRNLLILNTE